MKNKLGPAMSGSAGFSLLAAITALSLATTYMVQTSSQNKRAIDVAKNNGLRERMSIGSLADLSIIRSLLNESKTAAADYEPAVYPDNYFAAKWDLTSNNKFALAGVIPKGPAVKLRSLPSGELEAAAVASVLNGSATLATKMSAEQKLEIVKYNNDTVHPYYVSSVDVKATRSNPNAVGGDLITYGRIPLRAPTPKSLELQVKPASGGTFSSDLGSDASPLPGGDYVFRIVAEGVVHHGEIEIGGKKFIVGLNDQGRIIHSATNIKSKAELGQTEKMSLGATAEARADVKIEGCGLEISRSASGGSAASSVTISAKVYGVDGQEAKALAVTKEFKIGSVASADSEFDKGSCPGVCPMAEDDIIYKGDRSGFADYLSRVKGGSNASLDAFEPKKTNHLHILGAGGSMCGDYSRVAQFYTSKLGKDPGALFVSDPGFFWDNEPEAMKLKMLVAYSAPDCRRQEVGVRSGCGCFAAETLITMADGSERVASTIRAGDWLWNPKLKKGQAVKRVIAGPEALNLIRVEAGDLSVLVTTEHPFLTRDGLKSAKSIVAGDILIDGSELRVVSSAGPQLRAQGEAPPEVWNFELQGGADADEHYVVANGIMTGDLFLQIQLQQSKNP